MLNDASPVNIFAARWIFSSVSCTASSASLTLPRWLKAMISSVPVQAIDPLERRRVARGAFGGETTVLVRSCRLRRRGGEDLCCGGRGAEHVVCGHRRMGYGEVRGCYCSC